MHSAVRCLKPEENDVRWPVPIAAVLAFVLFWGATLPGASSGEGPVRIGSKKFTESVVLGEIASGLVRSAGIEAAHRKELGGTRVLWDALVNGEIDAYPEYTGTLIQEILAKEGVAGERGSGRRSCDTGSR